MIKITSLANAIFRGAVLFLLWSILRNIDPNLTETSLWARLAIGLVVGSVASLSNIGEK